MRPTTVLSSVNLSWVSRVNSSGLGTQLYGSQVLSVLEAEYMLSIQTVCGLPVRKSWTKLQREVLRPRRPSRVIPVIKMYNIS